MAVRVTVGILGGITMLFVGFVALSEAAAQSKSTAMNTTSGSNAWNLTTDVLDGAGQAAGPGVVWMGIAAIILIVCGLLYASTVGGGR